MAETQRLDRWLWFARFFKSRTLAASLCSGRKIRVNREVVSKTSTAIRPGDILTFPQGRHIRVVRVVELGERRGPASEARTLYEDLSPPEDKRAAESSPASREKGSGRPTKRERRQIERLRAVSEDDALG